MHKILIDNVAIVFIVFCSILPAPAQETGLVASWSFDENSGKTVFDKAGQIEDSLSGNYKYVGGVIGNSVRFDGYTTHVVREVDNVPMFEGSFTIEAWIAPQTYPWNWTAIVSHEVDHRGGYFFGVNALGQVGFQMAVNDDWRKCVSDVKIPLLHGHI